MFAGYCVGHRNHRYFCLFLLYMWLAVGYCTYFNTRFLMLHSDQLSWSALPKFIFPLVSLMTHDFSWMQMYIFFWSAHFAALLLTSVLLVYHCHLVLNGKTTHESNVHSTIYDLGWRQNLMEVFGENMHLTWVLPFVKSKLPHNGVDWDTKDTWKLEGPKGK